MAEPTHGVNSKVLVLAALLLLIGGWTFAPAISGGWVWDDVAEIPENAVLRQPEAWKDIWLRPAGPDFFPLKTTVEWGEWQLWHDRPEGYHLLSIGLHLGSALLLWRLLGRLGVRWAWLGGMLFAIHPVVVESVAWAAELKNTLSLPLLLLAILTYLDFDDTRSRGRYALAVALFAAAMLAKSSVVMLPAWLLLHAWWKRGRIDARDWARAAPFAAIALVLGWMTWRFQHQFAMQGWTIDAGGAGARMARAGLAVGFYLVQCIAPHRLSPLYSQWELGSSHPAFLLPGIGLAASGIWAWRRRASWGRHVLFGLGTFALNLAPVAGLLSMAYLRYAFVADHFAYLPLVGIVSLAAAGGGGLARRLGWPGTVLAAALLVGLCAAASRRYVRVFHDSATLWSRVLADDAGSWLAHYNLGLAEVQEGRVAEGRAHFEAAVRLRPGLAEAHNNLGYTLLLDRRFAEAEAQLREAARLDASDPLARMNLGLALAAQGDWTGAIREQTAAVSLSPRSVACRRALAETQARAGHWSDAYEQLARCLRLDPADPTLRVEAAEALTAAGRLAEAIPVYREALRLKPDWPEVQVNFGNTLAQVGRLTEAVGLYRAALRAQPDLADAHYNLANALALRGDRWAAVAEYQAALRLRPDYPGARENLTRLQGLPSPP